MNGKKEMVVYVKLDEYKDIIEILGLTKSRLKQARYIIEKISEIKKDEDREIQKWSSELDEVEERINVIDDTLTEPEV